MDLQRLSRNVILGFRYLFVPVPSTVFFIMGEGLFLQWQSSPRGMATLFKWGHSDSVYLVSLIIGTELVQLTLGIWSLILLDVFARRLREYMAAVTLLVILLSLVPGSIFYAQHHDYGLKPGQSFGMIFVRALLGIGGPLMLSYLAAWYLRVLAMGRFGEKDGGGG